MIAARGGLQEVRRSFRAMNTDVEVAIVAPPVEARGAAAALAAVQRCFERVEAALSRFRPCSELCALNAAAGRPFRASPLLFAAVSEAVAAAAATDGLFDPTILPALVAAGYDRSFELLPDGRAALPAPPGRRFDWRAIRLDRATRTILLPAGCAIDLGGIGKGWALDRAARRLARFRNFGLDAGGDLVLAGAPADGLAWPVGVQDPLAPASDLLCLKLTDCAVATSTVAQRRWLCGGRVQHHLIDPRSGRPARSGALAATVVARSATRAETLAKAALLLGPGAGLRFLDRQPDAEGLIVLDGGYIQRSAGLRRL